MSFSVFSKDFTDNMFTAVENQFIVKYLPQANGDAVRVYLYGLYLCNCKAELDGESLAKLLRLPYEKLVEIYNFWEECDLVCVLSRNPLMVEYLPVNAAIGKPKSIRPEKYAQFNRELMRILQKAGKEFKPYEIQRILEFLENYPMEQQAFLLVAEYCLKKDGDKLSSSHILNKAKKLCGEYKYTYEQVEKEFADFNAHEREMTKIFSLLGIFKKPQESDYDYLEKWEKEVEIEAVYEGAKVLKKGTLSTLDLLVGELVQRNLRSKDEAREYFMLRAKHADLAFSIGRKLGVKVQNPAAYIEEYIEKWTERGYEEESLLQIASLSFKLGYGFEEMSALVDSLYQSGIVNEADVAKNVSEREKQLKILQSIQKICGAVKKTVPALDMIQTWQHWNFSESMILEAAKRASTASSPLSYMNKLLSDWKSQGAYLISQIPEKAPAQPIQKSDAVKNADERSDRERYYAILRQRADSRAEAVKKRANEDMAFSKTEREIKKTEIQLAKAEVFNPDEAERFKQKLQELQSEWAIALSRLNLTEEDFIPKYACEKCSDTGFLPNGRPCDCYRPQ